MRVCLWTEQSVQSPANAIWHSGADSRVETVSRGCRCAEQRVCASVTVENVRWSSWRSPRAARQGSPARPVATRGSDASVTWNVRMQKVRNALTCQSMKNVYEKHKCKSKHAHWPYSSWLSADLELSFLYMSWTASSLIVHKRRWITHHWAQVYKAHLYNAVCVCLCTYL